MKRLLAFLPILAMLPLGAACDSVADALSIGIGVTAVAATFSDPP